MMLGRCVFSGLRFCGGDRLYGFVLGLWKLGYTEVLSELRDEKLIPPSTAVGLIMSWFLA